MIPKDIRPTLLAGKIVVRLYGLICPSIPGLITAYDGEIRKVGDTVMMCKEGDKLGSIPLTIAHETSVQIDNIEPHPCHVCEIDDFAKEVSARIVHGMALDLAVDRVVSRQTSKFLPWTYFAGQVIHLGDRYCTFAYGFIEREGSNAQDS